MFAGLAPSWAQDAVVIAGSGFPITGVDVYRPADSLVVYTPANGQTVTPTNKWGAEVTVIGGVVTGVNDRQSTDAPATVVPTNGVVLSGHGDARSWLLSLASIGTRVSLPPSLGGGGSASCQAGTISLTFDDGPSEAGTTAAVLDTLKARGLSATFYVVGANVAANPGLVARMAAEGHTIGNHTLNHLRLTSLTPQTTTPTNQWGAEVTVNSKSVVTAVNDRQTSGAGPVAIPSGGTVLSGHGTARTWLLRNALVGRKVTLPSPIASAAGKTLTINSLKFPIAVVNDKRGTDQLAVYTQLTANQRVALELSRTTTAIKSATGVAPTSWRPPESAYTTEIQTIASSQGLTMALFDVDSLDWSGISATAVRENVVSQAHDGAVVDLHDTGQNTVDALPGIIDDLQAAGYCLK